MKNFGLIKNRMCKNLINFFYIPVLIVGFGLNLAAAPLNSSKVKKSKASLKTVVKKPVIVEREVFAPTSKAILPIENTYDQYSSNKKMQVEAYYSTWLPTAQGVDSGRIGKMAINSLVDLVNFEQSKLSLKYGLGLQQLKSEVLLKRRDGTYLAEQNINLISLRLGLEWSKNPIWVQGLSPFIGLNYLPSWVQASRSDIGPGMDRVESFVEMSMGLLWSPIKSQHDWQLQIGADVTTSTGKIFSSGKGVFVGTRFKI